MKRMGDSSERKQLLCSEQKEGSHTKEDLENLTWQWTAGKNEG